MSAPAFHEALTEAKKRPDKPYDASKFYADMGHEYAWMSPDYIANNLTEVQFYGYQQHTAELRRSRRRSLASAIVEEVISRIMPFFGYKKRS